MVMTIRRQSPKEFQKNFKNFRTAIAQKTRGGEEIIEAWRDLMLGKPWVPVLPDGREAPPQIPSGETRYRAACELADRLWGRSVPETEIVKAERAQAALRALSDEELERRVRSTLARGLRQLDERKPLPESTEAHTVAGSVPSTVPEGK
jgi:hypothetical protein